MTTPLDQIKTGILNNDMEAVSEGYFAMTGTKVVPSNT